MAVFKKSIVSFFMVLSYVSFGQVEGGGTIQLTERNQKYDELSLSEWKKFKRLESKLKLSESPSHDESLKLRSYAKDSIQILGVKLMAIKLLDEKRLLDRDISENKAYYIAVLNKLKESTIPSSEYLFLEEKMAFISQKELEKQLAQSQWLNIGMAVMTLALLIFFFWFKKRAQHADLPLLSKQEITVRNLILQGKTNKEIANELYISLSTVKTHITHIYHKLNVANRQELFQKSTGTST